jgi:N6-adenosine-specific RNA methylase IME4
MESGGGKIKRGADRHYPLMKTKEIEALPVAEICNDNAHLYLWTTNNFLPDALNVMRAWGFRYVTKISWIKADEREGAFVFQKAGLGQYFRGRDEVCLFGVRGAMPYKTDKLGKRLQGYSAFAAPRGVHSEKPEEMRAMIERVSYAPYIELFARRRVTGWDSWGDQLCPD